MRNSILLILFLFPINLFSQQDDERSYREKLRSGDYDPYIELTDADTLEWPSKFYISKIVNEIRDLSYKNDYFYVKFLNLETSYRDTLYVSSLGEEIIIYPEDEYLLEYPEGDRYFGNYGPYGWQEGDTVFQWRRYFEGELPHKWDLRDFPFDVQELKIQYRTGYDTSVTRIFEDKQVESKVVIGDLDFLKDGYTITGIETEKEYVEGPISDFPDSRRAGVYEKLIFKIKLERNSGYLFFKLFFGAFLSYIISLLVFFIDKKLFETRITLSLGGIFGAVGNKYFVENTLPEILVLTKADLINNVIIIFIIINIFLVIGQATKKINLGIFEKNNFAIYLSIIAFIVVNSLIILY